MPSPTKHRSASPSAAAISQTTHQRSRLSRQIHPVEESEPEVGADEDMEADDDAEDERLYCFCQKQSYGDVSEILNPAIYLCSQLCRWWHATMKTAVLTNGYVHF